MYAVYIYERYINYWTLLIKHEAFRQLNYGYCRLHCVLERHADRNIPVVITHSLNYPESTGC